jgi:hypothetical protein
MKNRKGQWVLKKGFCNRKNVLNITKNWAVKKRAMKRLATYLKRSGDRRKMMNTASWNRVMIIIISKNPILIIC